MAPRFVPRPLRKAARDTEFEMNAPASVLGALRQVTGLAYSPTEREALQESLRGVKSLETQKDNIRFLHRGPPTERLATGENEVPIGLWARRFGVPLGYRLLLFSLARFLRPRCCLELGTAAGFAALYVGTALELNGFGLLHTVEGDKNSYHVGAETLAPLAGTVVPHMGLFGDVLDRLLPEAAPLDFVFVDGAHSGTDELELAARLAPYLAAGAVAVYDDIRWSPSMTEAWKKIRRRPEVGFSADLGKQGLVEIRKDGRVPFHYEAPLGDASFGAATR